MAKITYIIVLRPGVNARPRARLFNKLTAVSFTYGQRSVMLHRVEMTEMCVRAHALARVCSKLKICVIVTGLANEP